MFYYQVKTRHSENKYEFASQIPMQKGQCFRVRSHDGTRHYPARFKVLTVSNIPKYKGKIVEILDADLNVDKF